MKAVFWDLGGVLLSNAWDHQERLAAVQHFHIDKNEFEERHAMLVSSFERGKITLDEYIDGTVFCRPRPFAREAFKDFMFSLSKARPDVLTFAQALSQSGKYLMGTLNNESRELNVYRIEKFNLPKIFQLFVSSCFVGLRKPESGIYHLALEMTQISPEQTCFVDDRPLNVEAAGAQGMKAIQMQSLEQLRNDLQKLGISL